MRTSVRPPRPLGRMLAVPKSALEPGSCLSGLGLGLAQGVLANDQEHLQGPLQKDLRSPRERGKTDRPCVLGSVCMHKISSHTCGREEACAPLCFPGDVCACEHTWAHTCTAVKDTAVTGRVNAGRGPGFRFSREKIQELHTGAYLTGLSGGLETAVRCSGQYSACHRERAPKCYGVFESVWAH